MKMNVRRERVNLLIHLAGNVGTNQMDPKSEITENLRFECGVMIIVAARGVRGGSISTRRLVLALETNFLRF
jgi:hypothetical protein